MFTSDFEKYELLGRWRLLELQSLYKNIFKEELKMTPFQYESYDSYYIKFNHETMKQEKIYFIEIKCRTKDYDSEGFTLETSKYKKLETARENLYLTKEEVNYLYINFTPTKTLIWNITNVKDYNLPIVYKDMNKTTVISKTDKKPKPQWLLPTSSAKILPFVMKENDVIQKYHFNSWVIPKVEQKIKQIGFDFLI